MYVCVHIFMYMEKCKKYRLHLQRWVYVYIYMFICMYICEHIFILICIYMHIHIYLYMYGKVQKVPAAPAEVDICLYVYISVHVYVGIYKDVHIYVFMYIHTYVNVYLFLLLCTQVFMYLSIYIIIITTFCNHIWYDINTIHIQVSYSSKHHYFYDLQALSSSLMGFFEKRKFRNFLMFLSAYEKDKPSTYMKGKTNISFSCHRVSWLCIIFLDLLCPFSNAFGRVYVFYVLHWHIE
jgi:hypothetical protein